jgi:hypothetical protein
MGLALLDGDFVVVWRQIAGKTGIGGGAGDSLGVEVTALCCENRGLMMVAQGLLGDEP